MGKVIELNPGDFGEAEASPPAAGKIIQLAPSDVEEILPASVDVGPEARRAAVGKAPEPRVQSDSELGLDTGAVSDVYVSPLVAKMFPSVAAELKKTPTNAAEASKRAEIAKLVSAQQDLNEVGRGVGAMALTGPVAQAGAAMGKAAKLSDAAANVVGGAVAGGAATGVTEGKIENIPAGTALGGALAGVSDLMGFIANRVSLSNAAKSFVAGRSKDAKEVAKFAQTDVADVLKKYEIGNVKSPQVAGEAIEASIIRAEATKKRALEAARNAGRDMRPEYLKTHPLAKQAMAEFDKAESELQILKALQPVAKRVAAAQAVKPTMMSRIGAGAGKVAKLALPAAAAGGAYQMFSGK